jgi:hypothetical protein
MIRYIALAAALAFSAPACAGDFDWDWGLGSGSPHAKHRYARKHTQRRHRHRRANRDGTRVMAYVKHKGKGKKEDGGYLCVEKVRGLGTQWIGTEGAMEAAKKDWMERVRYDHGESYVDMSNARDFESRCGRVSIGEIAGQVTYRCEVHARPCKPPLKDAQAAKATKKK